MSIAGRLAEAREIVHRFRAAVLTAACSGRLTADLRGEHPRAPMGTVEKAVAHRRRETRRFVEPSLNPHVAFSDLPETWRVVPLGLLLTDLQYGTSKRSAYDTPGTAVLRIPNASTGVVRTDDLKFAELTAPEAATLRLRPGDLLMIRSNGSVGLVGLTAEVTESAVGMAYAGYLIRLRVDPDFLTPGFLRLVLASPELRRQIEVPARSTSGVHNINSREIRSLGVPLPPLDEQHEIVRRATVALETADRLTGGISVAQAALDDASRGVLATAFRGDLVPLMPE